jgi:hypothetical protein
MQGAEGDAVLLVLRTLRNAADAAGSARPEGKNAGLSERDFLKVNTSAFL